VNPIKSHRFRGPVIFAIIGLFLELVPIMVSLHVSTLPHDQQGEAAWGTLFAVVLFGIPGFFFLLPAGLILIKRIAQSVFNKLSKQ